ncbi:hypothetical protein Gotur_006478 [Gossypium turneri]
MVALELSRRSPLPKSMY